MSKDKAVFDTRREREEDSSDYEELDHYLTEELEQISLIKYHTKKIYPARKLCALIEGEELILDPEWQREDLWTPETKSLFIESILLGFPIQPIYLHLNNEGNLITVDGKQRLSTLYQVYKGNFNISSFEFIPLPEKKSERCLTDVQFRRVMDFKLECVVFNKVLGSGAIYRFFERINTKGVRLSTMEIRNCIYNGDGLRFIRRIARDPRFSEFTDNGFKKTRQRDLEAVLRFFATYYYQFLLEEYKDMATLLDNTCLALNNHPKAELKKMERDFWAALEVSYEVFGRMSFRREHESGRRSRANMSIFEAILYFIHENSKTKILKSKEKILQKYLKLFDDEGFLESVGRRSYELDMMDFRLDHVNNELRKCLK